MMLESDYELVKELRRMAALYKLKSPVLSELLQRAAETIEVMGEGDDYE